MSTISNAFKSIKNLAKAMSQEDNKNITNSDGILFNIYNENININKINKYYIDNIDFIYTPTYKEVSTNSKFKSEVILLEEYKPFGAIINTNSKDYNTLFKSNDISINIIDINGKRFLTSPTGFPCEIERIDGKIEKNTIFGIEYLDSKNHRNDIKVEKIKALIIEADKTYYYFNDDLNNKYEELKELLNKPSNTNVEDKLAKLNKLYESKLIREEEYKKKVEEMLNEI